MCVGKPKEENNRQGKDRKWAVVTGTDGLNTVM
jgi:hypothetical protein